MTKLHQFLFGENDYTPSSTVQVSVRILPTPRMIWENLTIQNMMSMDIRRIIPDMTAAIRITVTELADIRTAATEMAALAMDIQKIPAVIMDLRQMAAVQTVEAATVIPRYRIPVPATVVISVEGVWNKGKQFYLYEEKSRDRKEEMYMKSLKKIGVLLFAVCFLMLYPSVCVHAAEGTLQFSDPTASRRGCYSQS